jgi:hypothetical protein
MMNASRKITKVGVSVRRVPATGSNSDQRDAGPPSQ